MALAWELVRSHAFGTIPTPQELTLLGIILGLAAIGQYGDQLIARVRKVGPVEFFDRQIASVSGPLKHLLPWGEDFDAEGRELSPTQRYEYEKADLFVSTLEFSGVSKTPLVRDRKFHELLYQISVIAMNEEHWPRACDRLEQLIEASNGNYEPVKAYYSLGLCYRRLAGANTGEERSRLYKKALGQFRKAAAHTNDHLTYFWIAFIQDELGSYSQAVRSNQRALELCPNFAPSKYNLACSYVKQRKFTEAVERLASISPDDEMGQVTLRSASQDEDLAPLKNDPAWKQQVANVLQPYDEGEGPASGE